LAIPRRLGVAGGPLHQRRVKLTGELRAPVVSAAEDRWAQNKDASLDEHAEKG